MPPKTKEDAALTPEQPSLSPARQELKGAIAALEKAENSFQQATRVVQLAERALEKSRADVTSFSDTDQRIIAFRVQALKRGESSTALPSELRDAHLEKIRAKEELEHGQATLAQVEGDHTQAHATLQAARARHESAVIAVIAEAAQILLAQLREAEQHREHLRILLGGIGTPSFTPQQWAFLASEQRLNVLNSSLQEAGLPFGNVQEWDELRGVISKAAFEHDPIISEPERKIADFNSAGYWREFAKAITAGSVGAPDPLPTWESLLHTENPSTL